MRNRIEDIILWIFMFVVIMCYAMNVHQWTDQAILGVALIWLGSLAIVVASRIRRWVNHQKVIMKHLQEGELDQFLEKTDLLLKSAKNTSDMIKVNKSAGLCYKGAWAEALTLLNEINVEKLKPVFRLLYANNRLFTLLIMGDLAEAQSCREQYANLFNQPISHASIHRAVANTLACYEFYLGDIQKAKSLFLSLPTANVGRPSKAIECYFLGLIAMKQGDLQTGQEYLRQAEELGRNTFLPAQIQKDRAAFNG